MTYVQYPYAVLAQLGANLSDISERLSTKQRGADDCDGLGPGEQQRIQQAIEDFRSTWKTSVHSLIEDVDRWGGLSKGIGDMVEQFDAQAAAALAPSSGP